ncbi:MAG TPA: amidase [Burkholderiaceae bacterium]|nr:amidase [Burkholderiaceae bacterium]
MKKSSPVANMLYELDAVALSAAIRQRQISCLETLDAFLDRVEAVNPRVNALVALLERDTLRQEAKRLDDLLGRGQWLGPLHGLPQAPKDIMPAAGMVTTRGSLIFRDQVSASDAVVFERMRQAGAVFIGRSNTPELGLGGHTYNAVYGLTRNAYDPSKSAGGSSGGAAVAVALHMLPVADGSDMMGSLRTPAAFNSVYGLRTSLGCVPHGPTEDVFFQQFAVAGPMARNIPDLAMLFSVQAGYDARLPLTRKSSPDHCVQNLDRDFRGARIGWLADLSGRLAMEAGVLAVCENALKTFDSVGARVEPVTISFDFEALWQAWLTLRSFNVAGNYAHLYHDADKRALLKPEAIWEIERGLKLSAMDVFQATRMRSSWYQTLRALFENFDFLVLPGSQTFPFEAEQDWPTHIGDREMRTYHQWLECMIPATLAGLPTLCAPAGFNSDGLPTGLQIIAPPQEDWHVLQLGHAYDQASGHLRSHRPFME